MRLENGRQMNIIELPMPAAIVHEDMRLPASYANFYICNKYVIVPTFRDKNDDKAMAVLQEAFADKVGVHRTYIGLRKDFYTIDDIPSGNYCFTALDIISILIRAIHGC